MRGRWRTLIVAALGLALMAPAVAAPSSSQAAYDAAQAAFDREDWDAAIKGFQPLLPPGDGALSPSRAVIAGRLAAALAKVGRSEEALALAKRAITALSENAGEPLAEVLIAAGDAARLQFEPNEAAAYYRRAAAVARKAGNQQFVLASRFGVANALMTVDPGSVAAELDGILEDKAALAGAPKRTIAIVEGLRARAAMNLGDLDVARRWITRAIDDAGGMGLKVGLIDLSLRNDAAIIYSLLHDDDNVRKMIAFTGAGHLKEASWIRGYEGELPVCGPDTGIAPQDTVVVRFAIADDGHLGLVEPLYASKPGLLGTRFAQAVSDWRWDAKLLTTAPPLWRQTLVFQLRCVTRPQPFSVAAAIHRDIAEWFADRGVGDFFDREKRAASAPAGKEINAAALAGLFERYGRSRDESLVPAIDEALGALQAPASVVAYARYVQSRHQPKASSPRQVRRWVAMTLASRLSDFARRFPDTPALVWLKLEQALALEDSGDFAGAEPVLAAILAMPPSALPQNEPMRQAALVHQALVLRRLGKPVDNGLLAKAGLDVEQCSLFDLHPVKTAGNIGSDDFPLEALRWGFEGFVREAFDIGNDGRVANIRTVIGYPPFIFGPAMERAIARYRYLPPTIGDKSVGCTANTESINFVVPH